MIHLNQKMTNGATVWDWLGTAATAASVAVNALEEIRAGSTTDPEAFTLVLEYLEQARLEVISVQSVAS